jgi:putative membrane protein
MSMSGTYRTDAHPSRRWLWLPVIVAASLIVVAFASWTYYGAQGPAYANGPWLWFPFGWFLFIPAFFLIFFSLRWFFWGGWGWGWRGGWYGGGYYDPALQMLRERFAKGEITKEQYDQMLRDLER